MYSFLIIISVIIAIFLIIAVLLQASKGDGLSGSIGGGMGMGSMFGARRTADFLSRATWWLGGSLIVLALVINMFFVTDATTVEQRESIIQQGGRNAAPDLSLPMTAPETPAPSESQPDNN